MTGPFDPLADREWRATQLQLQIGVQYAIYQVAGLTLMLGVSLFFVGSAPYGVLAVLGIFAFLCLKNIRRLEKLSHLLQDQQDKIDAYDPD